jgi:hypothetical protein
MWLELLLSVSVTAVVSILCLQLVPDRWNRIDLRVGLSGLTVSAEDDTDGPE